MKLTNKIIAFGLVSALLVVSGCAKKQAQAPVDSGHYTTHHYSSSSSKLGR